MFIDVEKKVDFYSDFLKNYENPYPQYGPVSLEETWFRCDVKVSFKKNNKTFVVQHDIGFYFQLWASIAKKLDGSPVSFFSCTIFSNKNGCELKFLNDTVKLTRREFFKFAEFNSLLFRDHILMLERLNETKDFSSSFKEFGVDNFNFFSENCAKGFLELERALS